MTKEIILEYFEKNKGQIISGEELSQRIGVTRAAIWKAINSLREEGYDIESIKKKGYILNINSDILSSIKIKSELKQERYDLRIYKTLESTNKVAKLAAITEERDTIVIASEEQEQGKGRGQKHFSSPTGKGVYMSILLRPKIDLEKKYLLTYLGSVIAIEAIRELTGIEAQVRLPNEIVYQGKKLGGILSEAILEIESNTIEAIIIGIGINIYGTQEDFLGQKSDINGSLSDITGEYCNRSELIGHILNRLDEYYPYLLEQADNLEIKWKNYQEKK